MASTPNDQQIPKFLPPHLRRKYMTSAADVSPSIKAESDQKLSSEKLASITASQGRTSLAVAKGSSTQHESMEPDSNEKHAGLTVSQGLARLAAKKTDAECKSKKPDSDEKHVGSVVNQRLVPLAAVVGDMEYERVEIHSGGKHDIAMSIQNLTRLAATKGKTSTKRVVASKTDSETGESKENPVAEDDWVLDSEGLAVGKLQVLTGGLQ